MLHRWCYYFRSNPTPTSLLAELLEGNTPEAKHFQKEIRSYNNTLTFTSCCYTAHERLRGQGGIQPFQIHVELFHLQGTLQQHEGRIPNYAQLYFYIQQLQIHLEWQELLFFANLFSNC